MLCIYTYILDLGIVYKVQNDDKCIIYFYFDNTSSFDLKIHR